MATQLPPGPFSFPIVGALFSLRMPLHQHFATISQRYGPLIYLKVGMAPLVVVNNSEMASQVLKTHDLDFANRPEEELLRLIGHDFNDILTIPVCEKWKTMRKICNVNLFSNSMLNTSAQFREFEIKQVLKSIFLQSGTEINLREVFNRLFSNSMSLILFGERDLELVDLVRAVASLTLNLNIGVLIPALDRFDFHGIYKKMNTDLMPRLKKHLKNQFHKHQQEKERAGVMFVPRDFTDALISLEEDELSSISKMAMLSDMVLTGLETVLVTTEWTMAELINHPEVMAKAQDEIDKVVGRTRMVQESDLPDLPYVEAILKESLRLHPAAPLGAPHKSLKPVNVGDYTVPANCKVLVNIWAIGRDPAHWNDPEKFQPERFLGSNTPFSGQQFDFIPFSSGRRVCAGYPLAVRSISYFMACFIQAFGWRSGQSGINMEESTNSFTMNMTSDLIAIASPRVDQSIFD